MFFSQRDPDRLGPAVAHVKVVMMMMMMTMMVIMVMIMMMMMMLLRMCKEKDTPSIFVRMP